MKILGVRPSGLLCELAIIKNVPLWRLTNRTFIFTKDEGNTEYLYRLQGVREAQYSLGEMGLFYTFDIKDLCCIEAIKGVII